MNIAFYTLNNDVIYFYSFGVEHILKEIKIFIRNKIIKTNIFRTQAFESIIWEYFYIEYFDFMLVIDYTSLFSPGNFEKYDEINLGYFENDWSN